MEEADLTRLECELDELLRSIRELEQKANSIRAILDCAKGADLAGIDYQAIQQNAKKLDFNSHPLHNKKKPEVAELYLIGLLLLAQYETEDLTPLLTFVQWIRDQAGVRRSLNKLLEKSYAADEKLFELLEKNLHGSLLDMFFLDLLVGACLRGPAGTQALELISRLAEQLRINEENLEIVAVAARCVLRGKAEQRDKLDKLPRSCTSYLPRDLQRIVLKPRLEDTKWNYPLFRAVQKGEKIGRSLRAPCSGTFYSGTDRMELYAVISRDDDDREAIKIWLRQRKQRKGR